MDPDSERAYAERAGSGEILIRSGDSPVKLLTKAARTIGDHVSLWVRFPDGSRCKARPVLGDWMGGTEQRPWPDVEFVPEEDGEKLPNFLKALREIPREALTDGIENVSPDPPEGSRERLILDTIRNTQFAGTDFHGNSAELARAVEKALHESALGDPRHLGRAPECTDAPPPVVVLKEQAEERLRRVARIIENGQIGGRKPREILETIKATALEGIGTWVDPAWVKLRAERDELAEECKQADERATEALLRAEQAEEKLRDREVVVEEAAWRGEPPAEGTRRRLIFDTICRPDVLSVTEALEIADEIESALTRCEAAQVDHPGRQHDEAQLKEKREEAAEAHALLDALGVPKGPEISPPTVLNRLRELHGDRRYAKRDDEWVTEVAYQAAGAATGPLLQDHPDYVFPSERVSERVAELLRDFNIEVPASYGNRLDRGEEPGPAPSCDEERDLTEYEARLLEQREDARAGESRLMEQRNAALGLLRWLIGDLIPPYPGFEEEGD